MWFANIKDSRLLHWSAATDSFDVVDPEKSGTPMVHHVGGVTDLAVDKQGDLWASFEGGGIMHFSGKGRFINHFSVQDGLPTNYVTALTFDGKGRLWTGTLKGLACISPKEGRIQVFNRSKGLPDERFEDKVSLYDPASGKMWFGTPGMVMRFDPDTLLSIFQDRPKVLIDAVMINGIARNEGISGPREFQPNENNVTIQFVAPDQTDGTSIEYSYMLEGAAKDWSPPSTNTVANYVSLGAGHYRFLVRSRHTGQRDWLVMDTPFEFTIASPWYRKWWAMAFFAFLLGAMVWGLSRLYYQRKAERQRAESEKLQAVEKERTRIATDMHDDFGASLSRIKFLGEKSLLNVHDKDTLEADLERIMRYSTEMSDKMGEIVWALNNRHDSLGDLVSFCRAYAGEYLEGKDIRLDFQAEGPMDLPVSGEVRRNLFLITKEALHNTVKHADADAVTISFRMNGRLRLDIADNGKGYEQASIRPFANGLKNITQRVEQINGKLSVDTGSGVRITIDVDPTHPSKGL